MVDACNSETVNVLGCNDDDERNEYKCTPLHSACVRGNADCVKILTAKAGIHAPDSGGMTPLHLAVKFYRKEVVDHLLVAKADVTIKDSEGKTPIDIVMMMYIERQKYGGFKSVIRKMLQKLTSDQGEHLTSLLDTVLTKKMVQEVGKDGNKGRWLATVILQSATKHSVHLDILSIVVKHITNGNVKLEALPQLWIYLLKEQKIIDCL